MTKNAFLAAAIASLIGSAALPAAASASEFYNIFTGERNVGNDGWTGGSTSSSGLDIGDIKSPETPAATPDQPSEPESPSEPSDPEGPSEPGHGHGGHHSGGHHHGHGGGHNGNHGHGGPRGGIGHLDL